MSKLKKISSPKGKNAQFPIIVIGASAGGYKAAVEVLANLTADIDAAIFLVLHMTTVAHAPLLIQKVSTHTHYACKQAEDGENILIRTVYFAAPGMHLLFSENKIRVSTGADVNLFKPSIDVLFRSAAVIFRERVTGIILSGLLDDGSAGMKAIRACGGICMVQEPADAEHQDLPLSVLNGMIPDFKGTAAEIGQHIHLLPRRQPEKKVNVPEGLLIEAEIVENVLTNIDETWQLGKQSLFTCPDCGGILWHITEHGESRYRCYTGHAYSESILISKQNENISLTLWVALRMLEERKKMLLTIKTSLNTARRISELEHHIEQLKTLLSDLQKITNITDTHAEKNKSKTKKHRKAD